MSKGKSRSVRASSINPNDARVAFERWQAKIEGVPEGELLPIRLDVQAAAAVAHSIAVRDAAPERRQAFERLAKAELFDLSTLDSLPSLALAAWHVRQRQELVSAIDSGAVIAPAVLREAQERRGRMLKVLEYYFDVHPVFGPELAVIRSGAGYQDLANDLEVLADLYANDTVRVLIQRDPIHYDPQDPSRARELALTIFHGLGLVPRGEAAKWAQSTRQAWTLLSNAYDSLKRAGQYLFHDQEDTETTYPSLVSSVRAPATRHAVEPAPPPTTEPGPKVPSGAGT
jgi:hypothetical protein